MHNMVISLTIAQNGEIIYNMVKLINNCTTWWNAPTLYKMVKLKNNCKTWWNSQIFGQLQQERSCQGQSLAERWRKLCLKTGVVIFNPQVFFKCIDSCNFSTFWYSFSMLYLFIVMLKSMSWKSLKDSKILTAENTETLILVESQICSIKNIWTTWWNSETIVKHGEIHK